MDTKYWENIYKNGSIIKKPSLFAKFVLNKHIKDNASLIELGCGNGRDAIFFASNNINVLAVDQCKNKISELNSNKYKNLIFKAGDFTKLNKFGTFDNIYSRFTLHSITEKEENNLFLFVNSCLNKDGKIFIEVRGEKNGLFKVGKPVIGEINAFIYNGHFRRFLNINNICKKLESIKLRIISAEEKTGFAPLENEDFFFIRIVAQKNS
ncbi:MAG: class I SAM-dependent methyltransferase [Candidatus Magasanikbacteria bacterium]|nr:class I SAM-dependent methyltransferase [Candidatus Magasanikbacteria bacterium]